MSKLKVYIAGALNADNCFEFMDNVRLMMYYGNKVREMGASPFIPCWDVLESLMCGNLGDHSDYLESSMEWLKVCDALFVVPNVNNYGSKGLIKELEFCEKNNIPIIYQTEWEEFIIENNKNP